MKTDLTEHPNIGEELEKVLVKAGIRSFRELKSLGYEKVFLRIRAVEPDACLSKLQAIAGAIEGVRWHNLSVGKKQELKEFFRMLEK